MMRSSLYIISISILFLMACADHREKIVTINNTEIKFDAQGGAILPPGRETEYSPQSRSIKLPDAALYGYTFDGWFTAPYPANAVLAGGAGSHYIVADHTTLYARYTPNVYSITFDAQGGTADAASASAAFGETVTLPAAEYDGYFFEGWYQNIDSAEEIGYGGAGAEYTISNNYNITMYAKWKSILYMDDGDKIINGIVCVRVNAGTFTMGSPIDESGRYFDETQRQITLTQDFWISKYPITNRQYAKLFSDRSFPKNEEDHPVVNITWDEASAFAAAKSGNGFTAALPTEAQWEYAARGGHLNTGANAIYTTYSGGDNINVLGWYGENSNGKTQIVGQSPPALQPNALGIHDMSGNVWEWCRDWYGVPAAGAATDPEGEAAGIGRVYKGGGYASNAQECRIANRPYLQPNAKRGDLGFRVVFAEVK